MDIPKQATMTLVEKILAILGAVICLVGTILLWGGISNHQSMWPLPGLYFIMVAVLGVLGAFTFIWGGLIGKFITWVVGGALLGFSILGALSVGFFYLPAALLFIVISITYDLRTKGPILAHLAACLVAGLALVALMLMVATG